MANPTYTAELWITNAFGRFLSSARMMKAVANADASLEADAWALIDLAYVAGPATLKLREDGAVLWRKEVMGRAAHA